MKVSFVILFRNGSRQLIPIENKQLSMGISDEIEDATIAIDETKI